MQIPKSNCRFDWWLQSRVLNAPGCLVKKIQNHFEIIQNGQES